MVVIAFPDLASAYDRYRSPAYQAILPLRTEHSESAVIIVDGASEPHRAPDALKS